MLNCFQKHFLVFLCLNIIPAIYAMENADKPKTEILKAPLLKNNAVNVIAFYSLLYKTNEIKRQQETENVNDFLINNELMQVINQRKNNIFRPEDFRKMKRFIAQGADPRTTFEQWGDRISLLTLGIINNNTDFVKFLLNRGVDPTVPDDNSSKEKETPLGRMLFKISSQHVLNGNQKEMQALLKSVSLKKYENLEQKNEIINEDINDLIAEKNNLLEKLKNRKYTFQNLYKEKEKFENKRLSTENIQLSEEEEGIALIATLIEKNKFTIQKRALCIEKFNNWIHKNDKNRIESFYAMRRKEDKIERKLI